MSLDCWSREELEDAERVILEVANWHKPDNSMAKMKRTKMRTMIYKTTQKVKDWATPTPQKQGFHNLIDIYRHLINLQQKWMWKPIETAFKSVDFEHTCWRSSKIPWTLSVKSVSSKWIAPATFFIMWPVMQFQLYMLI
jgi:hypothetical protein